MIETVTSAGIAVPFRRSICASTARATAMALLPGRLATDERDRGLLAATRSPLAAPVPKRTYCVGSSDAILHLGHVPEVDRAAGVDAHHGRGHVVGAGEERAGLDDDVAVAGGQRPGDLLAIGRAEGPQRDR